MTIDWTKVITPEAKAARRQAELAEGVNRERQRRAEMGKVFAITGYGNVAVQGRDIDRANLSDLRNFAGQMLGAGSTSTLPFRGMDNVLNNLTPLQVIELWTKGFGYISQLYGASWALKDGPNPIPEDYDNDAYWPA